jgi:UPF0176 protein
MSYQVLLYYGFAQVDDPQDYAAATREICAYLGLKGRILIASEGINGTVSGPTEATERFIAWVHRDPRFADVWFKKDPSEDHVFSKLFVRVKPEIITLGVDLEKPPTELTGAYMTPAEWRDALDDENTVVLDGRNKYESDMGHFKGAICPPLESFREFPDWILEHKDLFEGKRILTYCTGGIRCEKLSAWMIQAGFEDVYQLHGGIVAHGQDPEVSGEGFEGVNVVFDDRIVIPVGEKAQVITTCRECETRTANYVNCSNVVCNERMILCPDCEVKVDRCCSDECRASEVKREKGQKLRQETRAKHQAKFAGKA